MVDTPESDGTQGLLYHPLADLFPLLDGEEFAELVADIAKHGVREPITLHDGRILDGRNRARAAAAAGVACPTRIYDGNDPLGFVISLNIRRRHLTASDKRDLIAKLLKADPSKSDRRIAEVVKVSPTTVGTVRSELEAKGDVSKLDTRQDSKGRGQPATKSREPVQLDFEQPAGPKTETVMLRTHLGEAVPYQLPRGRATFNRTNDQISWAAWSWNPVTGCLHNCKYCYAREIANQSRMADLYPIGFAPLFHHERLDAPKYTRVPEGQDPRLRRVFVCSMADLYGKWIPTEWIERVHASCIANPQWDYLFLTKFPQRYVGLQLPPTAWIGTTVDQQYRVKIAEEAFRKIQGVRVKWLSLEPLLEPLEFSDLSMFDWIVIGSQSATEQPDGRVPEFAPPFEWVARLVAQARQVGVAVYMKPNLLGVTGPQSPGMQLIQEEPRPCAAAADGDGEIPDIPTFLRRAPPDARAAAADAEVRS